MRTMLEDLRYVFVFVICLLYLCIYLTILFPQMSMCLGVAALHHCAVS